MRSNVDAERLLEVLRDNLRLRRELASLQDAATAAPALMQNYQQGPRARIAEILRDPRRLAD